MSSANMPGPGPNVNELPYGLGYLANTDNEIRDIYDDYTFKNNVVKQEVSERNQYFEHNST